MKTLELSFDLGQKVMVKEIQRPGRVEIAQLDNLGLMYRVSYWDNGERKSTWLYPDEIEPR